MSSTRSSNQIRVPSNKDYSVAAKEAHRQAWKKLELLQKRRESDAKCYANLTFSFEQLKLQVLDETTINHRVCREMILHETVSKIQYLEGILVLLEQTKDKQEGHVRKKSAGARLNALHREFGKSYNSSTHGNKKPKEKPMSQLLPIYKNKTSKMILPSQKSDMMILPKTSKATSNSELEEPRDVTDQVVPKPSPQIPQKESPPHTIIVPYIGSKNDYGPQEVPVCFSPDVRRLTPQMTSLLSSYAHQQDMNSSLQGTPSRRYKIKGSTIKCVPMDDMCWDNAADWETREDDSMDSNSMEPDLTCKEVFPYWLEESERNERSVRTETPLKPLNTSQMTYPYPMAPCKSKNTAWSAKYMEKLYEDEAREEGSRHQQRSGKRLLADMPVVAGTRTDVNRRSPYQNVHYVGANSDGKPKRHYRKLCTAARVRPYNHITGKVESPGKGFKNCRTTKRKACKAGLDPEFRLNSFYKDKMKKDDAGNCNIAVPARHQTKHTGSPEILHDGVDIMEDWMRKEEERQKALNTAIPAKPEDEINSQHSLVLTDVPHFPEDIISPLDIDDEGIVDTILDLEESYMPPIDSSPPDNSNHIQSRSSAAKATLQEGYFDVDQDIWNPDSDGDFFEKEFSDELPSDDAITPSLAAYACMALSNTVKNKFSICKTSPSKQDAQTAPIMSPVVYFSPVKDTPITRSNPTLSSTLLTDEDQLANTTRESHSEFSFASPLSTSSLLSNLGPALAIDVDKIKDVKEVQFDGACKVKDDDMWDIDKMMEIDLSLDELIDREVFLCSPKVIPRNFLFDSQDVQIPCADAAKMATPSNSDAMDQLLPSSWKYKDSGSNHLSSQDSMLDYQVVPNFLPSEDDGEILDLSVRPEDLSGVL